jgi:hypothetical protein
MNKQAFIDTQSGPYRERLFDHPLVKAALDDPHFADVGTLDVLVYLAEREPEVKRLVYEWVAAMDCAEVLWNRAIGPTAVWLRLGDGSIVDKTHATPEDWAQAAAYEASLKAEAGEQPSDN